MVDEKGTVLNILIQRHLFVGKEKVVTQAVLVPRI